MKTIFIIIAIIIVITIWFYAYCLIRVSDRSLRLDEEELREHLRKLEEEKHND